MDARLDQANIDNLTGLWRLMGAAQTPDGFHQSGSWPARYWRNWTQRDERLSLAQIKHIPTGCLFPVWQSGDDTRELEQQLSSQGFEVGLEQLAMVLPLGDSLETKDTHSLKLSLIKGPADAEVWADVCGRAFGYSLDARVIDQLQYQPNVEVLWAERDEQVVATAILYRTGPVVGVHQVGVPPEFQGQGVARAVMEVLLLRAKSLGAEYVSLQASAAGEPLYHKLGFQPQFKIRSYRRV